MAQFRLKNYSNGRDEGRRNSVLDKPRRFEDGTDTWRQRIKSGLYVGKEISSSGEYQLIEIDTSKSKGDTGWKADKKGVYRPSKGKKSFLYQPVPKIVYDFFDESKHVREEGDYPFQLPYKLSDIASRLVTYIVDEEGEDLEDITEWDNDEIYNILVEYQVLDWDELPEEDQPNLYKEVMKDIKEAAQKEYERRS